MRILIVSHRFPRHSIGGTEILANDTACALQHRGHQVVWLAAGPDATCAPSRRHRPDGIEEWEIPAENTPGYPLDWRRMEAVQKDRAARCLQEFGDGRSFDAVHLFHFARIGLRFLELEALAQVPLFVTLTDYTAVCPDYQLRNQVTGEICSGDVAPQTCLACIGSRDKTTAAERQIVDWRQRNIGVLSKRPAGIYVQTPHQRRILEGFSVPPRAFRQDRAAYHVEPDWHDDGPRPDGNYTFGYIGRASEEKGIGVAQAAFRALFQTDTGCRLRLITDRNAPDTADKECAGIDWRGPVPHDQIGRELRGMDCLLIPSLWLENHPTILTYALEAGLQVICSEVASLTHLRGLANLHFAAPGDVAAWRDCMTRVRDQHPQRRATPSGLPAFKTLITDIETAYRKASI
ncbi:glycosyltransferase [uncultured Roseobacter sp.]|uniref:glycosyltransferase n=1 Tax=uncultured Roseobacter sp. TaxID=114847 RepID=UPI002611BAE3|nr:glycosyltransferase [uncultured Roseobacter sp.]